MAPVRWQVRMGFVRLSWMISRVVTMPSAMAVVLIIKRKVAVMVRMWSPITR
jgi:hypothetical protein